MDLTPLLPMSLVNTPNFASIILSGMDFALPPTTAPAAPEERVQGLTPRNDSLVLEMTEEEPEGTSLLVATLRARPVQENDLLHARVTRNSVFLREDGAEA